MHKSDIQYTNIDEYIDTHPADIQVKLKELRAFIRNLVPNAEETISYGMPTFKLNGKQLIYFAAFKDHISIFPFPSTVAAFKEDLTDYKTSKGTIQFPLNNPIPYELVERIVKHRVQESMERIGKRSY